MFNNTTRDTGPGEFVSSTSDGLLWFAPAPANAVKVRVAEHWTVPTHPIPGTAYKGVRYWYFVSPKHWPTATRGKLCKDLPDNQKPDAGECKIQAYDSHDNPVPFGRDYVDPDWSVDPQRQPL